MKISEYFYDWEFACPCGCMYGLRVADWVDKPFLVRLDFARKNYKKPMKVTSGCRCKSYNAELRARGYKSVDGSAHEINIETGEKCQAVDIECSDSQTRSQMLNSLSLFQRVGISSSFIHVDSDETKPSPRLWVY